MIPEWFVFVGIAVNVVLSLDYIVATLKGKTKPNRVTWLIWALAPLIAFAGQIDEGVGVQSLMVLATGLIPLIIFAASFVNPQAVWKLGRIDYACGALSVTALIAWAITQEGTTAIFFALAADMLAGVLTLKKAYQHPSTERPLAFAGGFTAGTLTLLTLDQFTFENASFPLWVAFVSGTIVLLTVFPRGRATESVDEMDEALP